VLCCSREYFFKNIENCTVRNVMDKQSAKGNSKPACKEFEGHKSVTRFIVNPGTWLPEDNLTLWNFAAEETGAFIIE
jgi:hypothetical protein